MRIYLTHCSREKLPAAKRDGLEYPPDELYTDPGLQAFIARCRERGQAWAILSDRYGVFFPQEKHPYYEKPPADVTAAEEAEITRGFHAQLSEYDQIWFFTRSETFHSFYERVARNGALAGRVVVFDNLERIQ